MKKIIFPVLVTAILMSCGSDEVPDSEVEGAAAPAANQPAQAAAVPVPADIEQQFVKIMDEYQHKISKDFWSNFTNTTRRGKEGTTEITFDATAYAKYMEKKGFTLIPNTMLNYTGAIDSILVVIAHQSTSGEKGGWIQQFTIDVQTTTDAGTFKKQRQFTAQPGS